MLSEELNSLGVLGVDAAHDFSLESLIDRSQEQVHKDKEKKTHHSKEWDNCRPRLFICYQCKVWNIVLRCCEHPHSFESLVEIREVLSA